MNFWYVKTVRFYHFSNHDENVQINNRKKMNYRFL